MTKVVIDADLCIGCGACTGVAADSFILNDEGKAEFTGTISDEASVQVAIDGCPVQAISAED